MSERKYKKTLKTGSFVEIIKMIDEPVYTHEINAIKRFKKGQIVKVFMEYMNGNTCVFGKGICDILNIPTQNLKPMKTIKFKQWICKLTLNAYQNGRTAITLYDIDDDMPIATCTINVPEVDLEQNEVIIKNYSENEGILDTLINEGIVEKTGKIVSLGYVNCEICKLLINE
jgi:hypothetical protein